MVHSDQSNAAIAALLMEIEARKAAEALLRKDRDEWEDLYTNTECGYHALDAGGTVVRMNDIELFWLGYRREEVIGRMKLTQLISPECHDDFKYASGFFHEHGWIRQFHCDMLKKDGTTFPIVANVRAIKDEKGVFLRSSAAVFDITDIRHAQGELQRLNEMLEQRVNERTRELLMTQKILEAEIEERKSAESAARDSSRRLWDMTHRFVDVQEAVKRRLANELHDKVSSNLTAIGLNLRLIEGRLPQEGEVIDRLYRSQALVEETIASAREISGDLRPAVLDYGGLLAAVDDYGRQFQSRTAIAVEVVGTAIGTRLPPEKEFGLFRIVQDALTHCGKHSDSQCISIELRGDAEHAVLTIADDGVGFDPALLEKNTPALGLLSMRERAEAICGTLRVESLPGKGTRITVEA